MSKRNEAIKRIHNLMKGAGLTVKDYTISQPITVWHKEHQQNTQVCHVTIKNHDLAIAQNAISQKVTGIAIAYKDNEPSNKLTFTVYNFS